MFIVSKTGVHYNYFIIQEIIAKNKLSLLYDAYSKYNYYKLSKDINFIVSENCFILHDKKNDKFRAYYDNFAEYDVSYNIFVKNKNVVGKGICKYKNGDVYKGGFVNGKFQGIGQYKFEDGSYYKGEFQDDLFHGEGQMHYDNGVVYKGQFCNDEIVKHGKMLYKSGIKISGDWTNGIPNGLMTYHKNIISTKNIYVDNGNILIPKNQKKNTIIEINDEDKNRKISQSNSNKILYNINLHGSHDNKNGYSFVYKDNNVSKLLRNEHSNKIKTLDLLCNLVQNSTKYPNKTKIRINLRACYQTITESDIKTIISKLPDKKNLTIEYSDKAVDNYFTINHKPVPFNHHSKTHKIKIYNEHSEKYKQDLKKYGKQIQTIDGKKVLLTDVKFNDRMKKAIVIG